MSRTTTAVVSIGAMSHNLSQVRQRAPGARVWAVVKADAYGHGLLAALRGFADADGMALLEFDGAAALRDAGWRRPILMIEGAFDAADVLHAARLSLCLVVHCEDQLRWLEEHRGAPIDVLLKINTGLNRLGVPAARAAAFHERLRRCGSVATLGIMTHFANADMPGGAAAPLRLFDEASRGLAGERSLANSAAVLTLPASHRDWVRPGIILYGATPFSDRSAASFDLRPVMAMTGSVIAVQELAPGDSVGYGSTFSAPGRMRIGIVDCGYADGYPRLAPTGTPIAVGGVRTGTVGRVSMDMTAVDLTGIPQAGVGTAVEMWGATVSVDEVAEQAGTIGYELLCAVTARVRRETRADLLAVAS